MKIDRFPSLICLHYLEYCCEHYWLVYWGRLDFITLLFNLFVCSKKKIKNANDEFIEISLNLLILLLVFFFLNKRSGPISLIQYSTICAVRTSASHKQTNELYEHRDRYVRIGFCYENLTSIIHHHHGLFLLLLLLFYFWLCYYLYDIILLFSKHFQKCKRISVTLIILLLNILF